MRLLTDPTRLGLAVLLSILAALSLPVLASDAPGGVPDNPYSETPSESILVIRIQWAMVSLVVEGLPAHNILPNHTNPVTADPDWCRELSHAIAAASRRWDVSPWFLVAVAFREGSFRREATGDLDEQSTFQVMRSHGCDLSQVAGAADCAAKLLSNYARVCNSLERGFLRYATGRRICSPDTPRLEWMYRDRAGIARELEERFGAEVARE